MEQAELAYFDEARFIGQAIAGVLSKHAAEFLGVQETAYLLSEAEKVFPDLVAEVQRATPVAGLTELLRRLVQEDIPIRNLRKTLQAMLEWAPREKDVVALTEYARNALARQITYQYGGTSKVLYGVMLEPHAEELIRSSIQVTPIGSYLALAPEVTSALTKKIAAVAKDGKRPGGAVAVVVVSMDIRRYVKRMIALDVPDLPVLFYQDLASDARVIPLGQVSVLSLGEG